MTWGPVTVGGVQLRETIRADQTVDSLRISGQESNPPSTRAFVEGAHHNINGLGEAPGTVVPVVFTDKPTLTGFYKVEAASSALTVDLAGPMVTADWSFTLQRVGAAHDVEIESILPTIARPDELTGTQTPVFWHAPAIGATSYLTGATVPATSVDRVSADGTVHVYLGVPANVAPRWVSSAAGYLLGAARILTDGVRRAGTATPELATWQLHNGLVSLAPGADGSVVVSCWDGGQWRSAKSLQFTVNGVAVTTTPEVTILRNDPEEAGLRLTYPVAAGRLIVDLGVRRGARFATGTIKRHSVATLGIARHPSETEAVTAVTGGVRATSADADGNRLVIGSSRTLTLSGSSVSKTTVARLDFFLGHEVDDSPAAGDAFADLLSQYLGTAGEEARVIRR